MRSIPFHKTEYFEGTFRYIKTLEAPHNELEEERKRIKIFQAKIRSLLLYKTVIYNSLKEK